MKRFVEDIKKFDRVPFLFLGSGFSRRYLGTPSWEQLLMECTKWTGKSYRQYVSKVDYDEKSPMFLPEIARLIAKDFRPIWWENEKYSQQRLLMEDEVKSYASPLKFVTAEYIKKFKISSDEFITKEIQALKKIVENNSIDGIITTNWDCLSEEIFGFNKYIGQQELLFSNVMNVGEIFKIHGCVSEPNSMVFDSKDYEIFNKRNHYLASKLTTIFIEHPIIFIGYSIKDDNIREILDSIVYGIGEDNLLKFGNKIFFLECDFENKGEFIYTTSPLPLPNGTIDMTYMKTADFEGVYKALAENKRKFPAKLVRQMKAHLYELLVTDDPKEQIYVSDLTSEDSIENIQFVYGAGVKQSIIGYDSHKNDDLIRDIVGVGDFKFDYKQIIKRTLLTSGRTYLPVHYFIYKSGLKENEIDERILKRRVTKQDQLCKQTCIDLMNKKFKSISELEKFYGHDYKMVQQLVYLRPEKILDELDRFKKIILENLDLLDTGNDIQKTSIRKLVKYYDWLKFSGEFA
ncbi:SIR2 family protein [Bacillus sp. FSL K6-3458]|uniref:SIR2 family protein n=1 Tax=Bacillus TaxID=1386 RepID=UPI0030FBC8D9